MRFSWLTNILLSCCLLFSCRDDFEINNLNNNEISVLGHGGMGLSHFYPWNSFESVMKTLYLGADGTEIDIQLTRDSVFIAYHDRDLSERTTLSGMVYENTWEDIRHAKFDRLREESYTLASMDQIFTHAPDVEQQLFFLDVKYINPFNEASYNDVFISALQRLLGKHGLMENIYIELNDEELIQQIQNEVPDLKIFYYGTEFESSLEAAVSLDLEGIVMRTRELNADMVRRAHEKGVQVAAYASSRKENIKSIEINADHIQTDHVNHLLGRLK